MRLSLSRLDEVKPAWFDGGLQDRLTRLALEIGPAESVDLILVDDAFIRRLNRDFRGKDEATDVISFSYLEEQSVTPEEREVVGEIYVSIDTIEKEAKKLEVDERQLFLRVVVHGLLHVLGFDHEGGEEAAKMESEEKRILGEVLDPQAMERLFV